MGAIFTCCQKPSTTESDHPVQKEVVNIRNGEVHVDKVSDEDFKTPVADSHVEVEVSCPEEEVDDEMITANIETHSYSAPPQPVETREEQKQRTSIVRETPSQDSTSGTTARPSGVRTFGGGGAAAANSSSVSGGYRTVEDSSDDRSSYRTTTVETTETRVLKSSIPTLKATTPSTSNTTSTSDAPRPRPKVTIVRDFDTWFSLDEQ